MICLVDCQCRFFLFKGENLNFNPIIHSYFRRTLLGHILTFFNYYVNCFINGFFCSEKFIKDYGVSEDTISLNGEGGLKSIKDYIS
jgi:hypothetical protein